MITHLSIQGLALIEQLNIDFEPGFNVITGETGAGKSILIRALNFLTGAKVSSDVVRSGWDAAVVTGAFHLRPGHPARRQMEALGLVSGAEGEQAATVLVRRQLSPKGRGAAWINDVPVSLNTLRMVGQRLLDIFAQHENQRLLSPTEHVDYVDGFIEPKELRQNVEKLWAICRARIETLSECLSALKQHGRQADYLRFRQQELQAFNPLKEDFESVLGVCDQFERQRKIQEPLSKAAAYLEGGEGGAAPAQTLQEVARLLSGLDLESLRQKLQQAAADIDDVAFEVSRQLAQMEYDESAYESSQERLFGYQDLFRKHSVRDLAGLLAAGHALAEELESIGSQAATIERELNLLLEDAQRLQQACALLSTARQQAAQTIKEEVEQQLHELHMPGSVFQVDFSPVQRSPVELDFSEIDLKLAERWETAWEYLRGIGDKGAESAQFFLSANPGEPPLPLARVASGGELSRIMLALKKALAADAETCVMVFDEIDTGISGRVADVVGRKLRELSQGFQVLCISHLPQVAVYADQHFLVAKAGKGSRTSSTILRLSRQQSAEEIARLLSGERVTETSLSNAKNLMTAARKNTPLQAPSN